ncbi:MAG: TIM-barrel domain-containing protein [Solirubrobacteraceae bacterium]
MTAAPACATVTIGAQITVQGDGAGAVITRSPFGLAFENAGGQTVLAEAPATGAGQFVLPPTPARLATEPPGPALYAPLSFLVGQDRPATYTRYQEVGDLQSVEEDGTEYFAHEVLSAEPAGEGVRLIVSTNDPAGRTLAVTIAPRGSGAIEVSAVPSEPAGVAAMADSFGSSPGEAFHGFGGRHNLLDQHGQTFYNWVDQENFRAGGEQETNLSPDGPQAAYYVQSSFVSNHGYGFLLNRSELSTWRMDSEDPGAWQVQVAAPTLDYVVASGGMPQAIDTLTSITGRQRVPPAWLGPLFDQEVEYAQSPASYEARAEQNLSEFIARKVPLSAFRVEGWVYVSTAFREGLFARLRAHGIRPLVYFRPFAGDENSGENSKADFEAALAGHYFATTEGGEPFLFTSNYQHPAGLIDFTNPAAVQWWRERIFAALEMGAEGFMLDFGEQVQPGMHFFDGASAEQMHNLYPVIYQRVTREICEEFEASHPGRQIVFFTRSGYTGEPGTAAYESFNFPGDETTDWSQSSGLGSLTRDMLNRGIGGAYGYSTDIGGYYDVETPRTSRELFLRWAEWAALSPVFRLHGAVVGEHTPWGLHAVSAYRWLTKLHVSAEPLIRSLWQQADETGMPIARPLYLQYPEDPQAAAQDQEWLLGSDVLVAPVVEQGAASRSVYFPQGCWRNPETGQQVLGPGAQTVAADIKQLPFFFACGTEPFKPPGKYGRNL